MSKELSTLTDLFSGGELTTQSVEEMKQVEAMSQSTDFLPRIQLYSRGKAIDKNLIRGGHYGSPRSQEEILDLGASIDVLVFARKAKAIDMSDTDNVIVSHDPNSDEFKRIEEAAKEKDSGCAFGPTYLVYERSTGQFYEFFCGNKSARIESSKINLYLPVTPQMIEHGLTPESQPRGPLPLTLAAVYIDKGRFAWHAPKAGDCITPFEKVPTRDQLVEELERFFKKDEPEVEVVKETASKRRR